MGVFDKIRKLTNALSGLNANSIVFEVIGNDKEFQEEILDLNRLGQLFTKGEDNQGTDLNQLTQSGFGYAESTKAIKRRKGQPTSRVTLFDTGDFYKSFRLIVAPTFIDIQANGQKDDSNLFDDFGDDIVGLSDESIALLQDKMLPRVQAFIRNKINLALA